MIINIMIDKHNKNTKSKTLSKMKIINIMITKNIKINLIMKCRKLMKIKMKNKTIKMIKIDFLKSLKNYINFKKIKGMLTVKNSKMNKNKYRK